LFFRLLCYVGDELIYLFIKSFITYYYMNFIQATCNNNEIKYYYEHSIHN